MNLERGGKTLFLLAAFVVVCWGMREARDVLVPFLVAGFVASITAPVVFWMRDRGFPLGLAVMLAVLLDIAFLAGLGTLIGTSLAFFYEHLDEYIAEFQKYLALISLWLRGFGVDEAQLNNMVDAKWAMDQASLLFQSLFDALSKTLLVLVIVIFMLFEAVGIKVKIAAAFGLDEGMERFRRAANQVNKYLLVKTATSAGTAVIVAIWCMIWGIDQPLLWGLLAFLLNYIPTLGSMIAGIPPTLLALVQLGPGGMLGFLTGYIIMNAAIGNFVEPRIFGQALGLSPLVVFLSMLFWGWLLGPLGALFSVPLTMIVKIFLLNTEDFRWIAIMLAPARRIADGRLSVPPPPVRTPPRGVRAGAEAEESAPPAE